MKAILNRLTRHEFLSKEQAREILIQISEGSYNNSEIVAFLTVFMMRSISLEELEGFRAALLDLCLAVDLETLEWKSFHLRLNFSGILGSSRQ